MTRHYVGQYRRELDYKGRITFPKKYNRDFKEFGIFTNEIFEEEFRHLFVFPERFTDEIPERAGSQMYRLDKQNRLLIPQELRNYAGLRENVVVAGCINWIEIWNPKEFRYWMKIYEPRFSEIARHVYDLRSESQKQVTTVQAP